MNTKMNKDTLALNCELNSSNEFLPNSICRLVDNPSKIRGFV